MATFVPEVADDLDRDVIWDKRTWELLRAEPVDLTGLTCADCHRVREPYLLRRNRRTGEHHCYDGEDCAAAIAAHNAPWPAAELAAWERDNPARGAGGPR